MTNTSTSDSTLLAVYGAGSWGTALAIQSSRIGQPTCLWDIDPSATRAYCQNRENHRYLPGIAFPDELSCEADFDALAQRANTHLLVVPSHAFRATLEKLAPHLDANSTVLWATKGIEQDTGQLLSEIVNQVTPQVRNYGVLSGPTFAAEVAKGMPTAITLAASNSATAAHAAQLFHSTTFRTYTSDDIIALQVGGAVKNVLAIAAGISDGLGFGANARAAIITRGLAEMARLTETLGGTQSSLMGLSGIGDLVLTCTDDQSRNRQFGLALGQGKSREQAEAAINQAIEGVKSATSVFQLSQKNDLDMPICEAVYQVIEHHLPAAEAVTQLLSRKQTTEQITK